jgi:hypothetical protein
VYYFLLVPSKENTYNYDYDIDEIKEWLKNGTLPKRG